MVAETIILVIACLFLMISILLFNGKGKWLIAGYNTMTKEEQRKYDEKKLCRAVGSLCLECCLMLCIMAFLGYQVDSGAMNEKVMLFFGLFVLAAVVITLIIIGRYIKRKVKR